MRKREGQFDRSRRITALTLVALLLGPFALGLPRTPASSAGAPSLVQVGEHPADPAEPTESLSPIDAPWSAAEAGQAFSAALQRDCGRTHERVEGDSRPGFEQLPFKPPRSQA